MTQHRIKVSARVRSHLSGSSVWQEPQKCLDTGYERPEIVRMISAIKTAGTYADGSVQVDLNPEQCATLWEYAEVMEIGGRDNAHDPDGRADMNAARALMRQIDKKLGRA